MAQLADDDFDSVVADVQAYFQNAPAPTPPKKIEIQDLTQIAELCHRLGLDVSRAVWNLDAYKVLRERKQTMTKSELADFRKLHLALLASAEREDIRRMRQNPNENEDN